MRGSKENDWPRFIKNCSKSSRMFPPECGDLSSSLPTRWAFLQMRLACGVLRATLGGTIGVSRSPAGTTEISPPFLTVGDAKGRQTSPGGAAEWVNHTMRRPPPRRKAWQRGPVRAVRGHRLHRSFVPAGTIRNLAKTHR